MTSAGWGGEPLNWTASPQCWRHILSAYAKHFPVWVWCSSPESVRSFMSWNIFHEQLECLLQPSEKCVYVYPLSCFLSSSLILYLTFHSLPKRHDTFCMTTPYIGSELFLLRILAIFFTISFPESSISGISNLWGYNDWWSEIELM